LLDWTRSAAAALYFAVENPNDGSDSGVWAYKHQSFPWNPAVNPFDLDNVVVYDPPHIAARFTSQRGCFTAYPADFRDRETNRWLGDLKAFRIPADARVPIRRALRLIGVRSSLAVSRRGRGLRSPSGVGSHPRTMSGSNGRRAGSALNAAARSGGRPDQLGPGAAVGPA
jgi:hypothetical protein